MAYVIIDGTLIPVDRVAADRPFCSGKHKRHGVNLQVIVSPDGTILWVSGELPRLSTRRRGDHGSDGVVRVAWVARSVRVWRVRQFDRDTGVGEPEETVLL